MYMYEGQSYQSIEVPKVCLRSPGSHYFFNNNLPVVIFYRLNQACYLIFIILAALIVSL